MLVLLVVALLSALVIAYVLAAFRYEAISAAQSSSLRGSLALETAEAVVVGDIRAEIRAGSVSPLTQPWLVYPATGWSAVPFRTSGLPPNLLKQSAYGRVFFDGTLRASGALVYPRESQFAATSRAVAVSSSAPAINARGWDATRWNAPLLLPCKVHNSSDLTPASSGTAQANGRQTAWNWAPPDWILLSQSGMTPSVWKGTMRRGNFGAVERNPVVARFAYQIYDQGGLLDLNAAGCDPALLPDATASRKGGLALADLRKINLDEKFLSELVAWRNPGALSRGDGAPFGNRLLNYHYSQEQNGGFLRNGTVGSRAFQSRQALIQWVRARGRTSVETGTMRDALQYLTHFSRGLEQPSVRPGVYDGVSKTWKLPEIVPPASGLPDTVYPCTVASDLDTRDVRRMLNLPFEVALGNNRGGNDAWGTFSQRGQSGEGRIQNAVNPGILEVRVLVPFVRPDGTMARVGEALVKRRFALSRLAWLTWKGPSALLAKSDPLFNEHGTPKAIKTYFGLEWTSEQGIAYLSSDAPESPQDEVGSFFWRYDHSKPSGAVPSESIGRLQQVALDGREPDFFELLKAGILVGSLGKSALKQHSGMEGWAHDPAVVSQLRDKDPTNQILEIGANIIDQADADSFPTIVKIGAMTASVGGPSVFVPTFTARGVENLPYLYRLHWRAVENLLFPASPKTAEIRDVTARIADFIGEGFHSGTTSLIAIPELWNPHLVPTRRALETLKLRVVAVGEDSEGVTSGGNALRPAFPLLGQRWSALMRTGAGNDRHAHFASWPSGMYAFSIPIANKSTKAFFHDRRFGSSYEFYGTSADADDYHSARLSTNAPAEPSSYLFWSKVPTGTPDARFAIEGFTYWKLLSGAFSPSANPGNLTAPLVCRGASFRFDAPGKATDSAPVWFVPTDGRVVRSYSLPAVERLHADDPPPSRIELRNSELTFQLPASLPGLFREPTALCSPGMPLGSGLAFGGDNFFQSAPYSGILRAGDGTDWIGFSLGEVPSQFIAAQRLIATSKTTVSGAPVLSDGTGNMSNSGTLWRFFQVPVNLVGQRNWCALKLRLQYQLPDSEKWVTYDERFFNVDGRMEPDAPPYQGQWNAVAVEGKPSLAWAKPLLSACDPRTSRFGMFQRYSYNWKNAVEGTAGAEPKAQAAPLSSAGEGVSDRPKTNGTLGVMAALGGGPAGFNLSWLHFKAAMDQDPAALYAQYLKLGAWWAVRSLVACPSQNANDYGWISRFGNPTNVANSTVEGARGFSHFWEDYSHDAGMQESTETGKWQYWADSFRQGWLSENVAPDAASPNRQAYADADDVVRRAMGGYAGAGGYSAGGEGLPLAQMQSGSGRSRPLILDRPFRSVAELGATFRGVPWKQLDFASPETGDAALLDLFCISEPASDGMALVAGKLNLNTRQEPVLRALLAGALKDEGDESQRLSEAEVVVAARALLDRTSGTGFAKGPLTNLGELAGRVVGCNLSVPGALPPPNAYTASTVATSSLCAGLYTSVAPSTTTEPGRNPAIPPGTSLSWTFTGLSADLESVFSKNTDAKIPRYRESVLRALVDAGETRVWSLLLDLVLQTGHYPMSAEGAEQFFVESESRVWVHLAIDRFTGEILDRQVEHVRN